MDKLLHNRVSYVFLLLIIVFITLIFSLFTSSHQIDKINYIKSEITKDKSVIDSIYKKNKDLDAKINQINSKISKVDKRIDINNDKIDKLKQNEKNQIDKFKHYDSSMWEKYFTDRYSKK
jgi:peptidoglycan hydrolase CwlO-like protein